MFSVFLSFLSRAGLWLLPRAEAVAGVAVKELAGIAISAVLAEAPKAIAGHEKFGNAVDNVTSTVLAGGRVVAANAVEAAVETAAQALQSK